MTWIAAIADAVVDILRVSLIGSQSDVDEIDWIIGRSLVISWV